MGSNGIQSQAKNAATTAQGQSLAAYNTVVPTYQSMVNNPQGYSQLEQNNMLTASGQALGGGTAAATGLGALMAARTGNAGGSAAAIADAARSAGVTQSQNALGIQQQSAALQRQQQQQGLAGLSSIYDNANGTAVSNLNAANQAQAPFWQQLLRSTAAGAASGLTGR